MNLTGEATKNFALIFENGELKEEVTSLKKRNAEIETTVYEQIKELDRRQMIIHQLEKQLNEKNQKLQSKEQIVHCGECKYSVHQRYKTAPEWICVEYHNYCDCGAKIVKPDFFCGYGVKNVDNGNSSRAREVN